MIWVHLHERNRAVLATVWANWSETATYQPL